MSRVTPDDVKLIVATVLTDPVIQVWIDAANMVVDDKADCINKNEEGLTAVELYLSAHLITLLDPKKNGEITKFKIEGFETTYSSRGLSPELINRTPFGMTANMLSGGCLVSHTRPKASVAFV
jgi:hypothetical protein